MTDNVVDLAAKVAERVQAEEAHLAPLADQPKEKSGGPDDPRFVHGCIQNNERGDGLMFCALHRGRYLYNKIQARWYDWAGHYWQPDIMGAAVEGVEEVALKFANATDPITEQLAELEGDLKKAEQRADEALRNDDPATKRTADMDVAILDEQVRKFKADRAKLYKRADQLRAKVRAEKCLWWAHNVPGRLAVKGDEFDKKPLLLACPNGVIDLETGKLMPGNPDDLLVRSIKIPYDPNAEAPDWNKFLLDIYEGDQEKVDFIRRYLGYCLTGLTTEQIILFFIGDGANGKGTLVETMHYILDQLAWSISPELILEQKNPRPTAGASADIVSLYGRRLVIASETEKNRRIGAANLKRFTGGDTLNGRSPFDKEETNFDATHKMIGITNDLPLGLLSDFSLQRRIRIITHRLRYVADVAAEQLKDPQNADCYRQKNGELPKLLRQQAPGILADLVRACIEYQENGLTPPDSIIADAEAHRASEDHLGRFLAEACTRVDDDPDHRILFKDFYKSFAAWYTDEISDKDRFRPSKIAVTKDLEKKGYHKTQKSGQTWIHGIKLPPDEGLVKY
jgi:putative DNA primase/helicase